MKEKRQISLAGIGLSALLVVLAVLALTLFSLLSLSTARAQQRLGEKERAPVLAYYEAEAQAHEILAKLRAGEVPQGVAQGDGFYRYTCPMGENQLLAVEVEIGEDGYRIVRWQVCARGNWEADDSLPVWQGIEKE